MAYTVVEPRLICGNTLHFGSLTSGSYKLKIPCGWNKCKVFLSGSNVTFAFLPGIDTNYSLTPNIPSGSEIEVPTDYQIIPDNIPIQIASTTVITVIVLENKGTVNSDYWNYLQKKFYNVYGTPTVPTTPQATLEFSDSDIGQRKQISVPNTFNAYQWQMSVDGGTTWTNSASDGATSSTVSFVMSAQFDGRKFRCKVVDAFERTLISDVCTIVYVAPENNEAKAPTQEDLENDDKVLKIDVPEEEAKEIFENLEEEEKK